MGAGASTSVDLSLIENLEEQFLRYSEDEIFGALEATVSDAKSAKQLVLQIGELERLLATISGSEARRDMRARLQVRAQAGRLLAHARSLACVCVCRASTRCGAVCGAPACVRACVLRVFTPACTCTHAHARLCNTNAGGGEGVAGEATDADVPQERVRARADAVRGGGGRMRGRCIEA